MKNLVAITIFVMLTGVCFAEKPRTLQVSGTCSLSVNPDIVLFHVNIENIGSTLSAAKSKNDEVFHNLVSSLKKLGISEENIDLTNIRYTKHYEYVNRKNVHRGYKATQDLTVKLKNFSLFEKTLSAMVQNDDIKFSLGFDSSKSSTKKLEALKDALQTAKKKAEQMAAVYDMKLGAPVSIVEQNNSYNISVSNSYGMESRSSRTKLFGQITIAATVTVQFEILNK